MNFRKGGLLWRFNLCNFSAKSKQAASKNLFQNETQLKQIGHKAASGAGSRQGIEKVQCKMQQICNISSIGNKGYHRRCFISGSAAGGSPLPGFKRCPLALSKKGGRVGTKRNYE
jgi:hypothetical protein